jgi:hypothetical protein
MDEKANNHTFININVGFPIKIIKFIYRGRIIYGTFTPITNATTVAEKPFVIIKPFG